MRNYFTQSTQRNSQNTQSQLFANLVFFNFANFARTILDQEDNLQAQLPHIFIGNHNNEVFI
jgi:hypothetical protein